MLWKVVMMGLIVIVTKRYFLEIWAGHKIFATSVVRRVRRVVRRGGRLSGGRVFEGIRGDGA